jgi:lipopolysaccharide export LptBFGC system permease protein LptF
MWRLDRQLLSRAGVVGLVLAVLGIGLFVGLWAVLGNAGMDDFPRLVIAVCVPPAVLALAVGVFFLVARRE